MGCIIILQLVLLHLVAFYLNIEAWYTLIHYYYLLQVSFHFIVAHWIETFFNFWRKYEIENK